MNDSTTLYTSIETFGYQNFLYDSVEVPTLSPPSSNNAIKQACLAYCMTETGDQCDFVALNGTICYLGHLDVGGPWINPSASIDITLEVIFSPSEIVVTTV